jgi:hypothetical protein
MSNVKFEEDMILSNFESATTVALLAGKWEELATYKIPSQEIRYFGKGSIVSGVDNRGTFKLSVKTGADAVISGNARLVARDANGWNPKPIISPRSETLGADGEQLGYTGVGAKTDSYLAIEFRPDADATATIANCTLQLPTTVVQGASIIKG